MPSTPILPSSPQCCSKKAFSAMKRVVAMLDRPRAPDEDALLEGAVAIAQQAMPKVEKVQVEDSLDEFADQINARVRGPQWQARIAHLHDVLFDQEGFIGNTLNYHDAANSYLPRVLETRRGLPITLSLVYKLVAKRIGLSVRGIGLPGHFIVGVETPELSSDSKLHMGLNSGFHSGLMLIDPFFGGTLITADEALDRMRDTYGPEVEWSSDLLEPISDRHWLTRLIQNLLHSHSQAGRMNDVAAMIEMQMLLWPSQTHLQRDLGLVLARIGMTRPATAWLGRYLDACPDDPQKFDIEQLLQVLSA